MVNSSSCLKRRVASMSLVRICMVTMTILRLFLCVCSRARHKERMRKREILGRGDTDEEQPCGLVINLENKRSVVAQVQREMILRLFLTIKNHIFFASAVSKGMYMKKLGHIGGNLNPHEALVVPKTRQAWQDKRFRQIFKGWLLRMWRSRKFCQQDEENRHPVQTVVCHQVMNSQLLLERKEFCDIVEKETTAPTIAWVESPESYSFETPSCSYRQEEKSIKRSQGFQELEQTLKTLRDEAKEEAGTFSYRECLAYFGDTCPCRFLLPNQIVGLDLSSRSASPMPPPQPAPPTSINVELSFKSGLECEDVERRCRTNTGNEFGHQLSAPH